MVNMAGPSAYQLRRQPGAESFRAAWDAAQTLGLQPVKDEAFDRAMNGQLVPVFVGGKLMGFRRKKNDRLLMFILRHYGQDAQGRKTTINYFSTRAERQRAPPSSPGCRGEGRSRAKLPSSGPVRRLAAAEATTTTVKTVISGPGAAPASSPPTSAAAHPQRLRRRRARRRGPGRNLPHPGSLRRTPARARGRSRKRPRTPVHRRATRRTRCLGELESGVEGDWVEYRPEGEHLWENLGEGGGAAEIDEVLAGIEARQAAMTPEERAAEAEADRAAVEAPRAQQNFLPKPVLSGVEGPEPDPDDPRLDWRNWDETG